MCLNLPPTFHWQYAWFQFHCSGNSLSRRSIFGWNPCHGLDQIRAQSHSWNKNCKALPCWLPISNSIHLSSSIRISLIHCCKVSYVNETLGPQLALLSWATQFFYPRRQHSYQLFRDMVVVLFSSLVELLLSQCTLSPSFFGGDFTCWMHYFLGLLAWPRKQFVTCFQLKCQESENTTWKQE